MKTFNGKDLSLERRAERIWLVAKKVMLGISEQFVTCSATARNFVETGDQVTDVLIQLHQANSARHLYEAEPNLPLEDLFFVGGRLQRLIRRAEALLDSSSTKFPLETRSAMRTRVNEAKAFKRYVIERIVTAGLEGFGG